MFVGLWSIGEAAHTVISNPSGTWKRSSGIQFGTGGAAAGAGFCEGACPETTVARHTNNIRLSGERRDRRI
jgi:hypothetical protein